MAINIKTVINFFACEMVLPATGIYIPPRTTVHPSRAPVALPSDVHEKRTNKMFIYALVVNALEKLLKLSAELTMKVTLTNAHFPDHDARYARTCCAMVLEMRSFFDS